MGVYIYLYIHYISLIYIINIYIFIYIEKQRVNDKANMANSGEYNFTENMHIFKKSQIESNNT